MDIQFTEALYRPESKELVLFLYIEPQTVLHYRIVQVVNVHLNLAAGKKEDFRSRPRNS